MEHLELSENGGSMKSLSVESSTCSSLETVIIDGCVSLEEISSKGWAKPKNLLLSRSFPVLCSLDLSIWYTSENTGSECSDGPEARRAPPA
jgi:hypothetical protein